MDPAPPSTPPLYRPVVPRPSVAIVTTHWGDADDEATAVTRLLAGAVARHAEVDVCHLVPPTAVGAPEPGAARGAPVTARTDSVFRVHAVPVLGHRPLRAGLLQAALASGGRAALATSSLVDDEASAEGLVDLLVTLRPRAVVLAGRHQATEAAVLGRRGRPGAPRVVVLPYSASPAVLAGGRLRRALERADVVACLHPGEEAVLRSLGYDRAVPLDIGLPLNRGALAHRLFGVRHFGRYVLLVRAFPPGGPRLRRSVTHEVLRQALGGVSVAEVDGERWRISDAEGTLQLPVTPTRVNLWRLMAHAEITVDLRPPGPLGREALESMLLRTPVVVPDDSAPMAHVKAAGGGLWYRDVGDLLDAARVLLDPALNKRLGAQGADYALRHHGRIDDFVERVGSLVLGS